MRSVEQYYNEYREEERLTSTARGQLEFERSKQIILRFLAKPPGSVVDVGGGIGPYCFWLAEHGYQTHLIEPSSRLVNLCLSRTRDGGGPGPLSAKAGDARQLWCPDGFADAVLLMGPLYHLTESADRRQAIRETLRILRPGGLVFAATIARGASLIDVLWYDLFGSPFARQMVAADLATGQHRNTTEELLYFTDAFFHRADEILNEMEVGGFEILAQVPVEGLGAVTPNLETIWTDPIRRETLLNLLEAAEAVPEIKGATTHLMSVGRKPA